MQVREPLSAYSQETSDGVQVRQALIPSYETIKAVTSTWQPSAGLVYFHLPLDNLSKKGVLLER
jgi:hypothetical protein